MWRKPCGVRQTTRHARFVLLPALMLWRWPSHDEIHAEKFTLKPEA
jgi:hypothetical protein